MRKIVYSVLGVIVVVSFVLVYFVKNIGSVRIPPFDTTKEVGESDFMLPEGFSSFDVFADSVPDARVLAFGPGGMLFASQPGEGHIIALADEDNDGKADEVIVVAERLNMPHGFAFRCTDPTRPENCDLYVAEYDALSVFTYDSVAKRAVDKKRLIDLPSQGPSSHVTRFLLFLPSPQENTLLISIGSSCNVCEEKDERRGSILSYNILSGEVEYFARGLRNAVFMTLHPVTGEVWATEMGRDGLGDDVPPDEINIIKKDGWYGWPWFYGNNIEDVTFSHITKPIFAHTPTPSFVDIQAHSAPLGLSFIPEEGWPEDHWFNLLVAYHGSWNRSEPTGYKIVRMIFDAQGNYIETKDFITGWLRDDGTKIGRPADILVLPGGVAYISDDAAGKIYKLLR